MSELVLDSSLVADTVRANVAEAVPFLLLVLLLQMGQQRFLHQRLEAAAAEAFVKKSAARLGEGDVANALVVAEWTGRRNWKRVRQGQRNRLHRKRLRNGRHLKTVEPFFLVLSCFFGSCCEGPARSSHSGMSLHHRLDYLNFWRRC